MKIKKTLAFLMLGVIAASFTAFHASAEDTVLFEGEASSSNWGQAWKAEAVKNEGGTFDPELLKPGSVIYVTYTGVSPEIVLQSWSGGEGWAKVAAAEDDGSVATFTYDDMIASFNTDDMSLLDCLNVGDTGGDITITLVSLSSEIPEEQEGAEAELQETENENAPANDKGKVNTGIEGIAAIGGIALAGICGVLVSRKKR